MAEKKVKVERVNKKGRTEAVEKALRALGAMKQGDIQEKYPSKGTRSPEGKPSPPEGKPSKLTQKDKEELSKLRPPRDPGADERMMEFERSAREQGFADGGMVRGCKGFQMSGKGFKGTF
jgi:hypothetical protein